MYEIDFCANSQVKYISFDGHKSVLLKLLNFPELVE